MAGSEDKLFEVINALRPGNVGADPCRFNARQTARETRAVFMRSLAAETSPREGLSCARYNGDRTSGRISGCCAY
jgi:hypothetical protein